MRVNLMRGATIAAFLAGAAIIAPAAAAAETVTPTGGIVVKPIVDARLRYEHVEQDGLARDADAVTVRLRAGVELSSGPWSLLAEGETTLALSERYNSGLNSRTQFPIVADPENVELNRFQIQYRGIDGVVVTAGRQRINLDDQRFVGSSGARDNEQTFDAVRVEYGGIGGFKGDVTYAWSDRTIWGIDGAGARQQAIGGDNLFANLGYATLYGTLTAFAFLVDQDEASVSGFRLSSQTYGARFAGSRKLSANATLTYAMSYARQSDYHRNPNDYSANYLALDAGLDLAAFKLRGGYEVLGADDGRPLTSVQTPLATLHKFQGWADKFLTTPPDGIRDLYAGAG
ncbi:MAG: hypothetical protein LH465_09520, partial [Sphingomonas bacterium]|nr:hypothetical protein [Sphingomonas bacterium]